jgi:hypothetical protein
VSSAAERAELLAWIAREPRSYPDAIEVWKTQCPRHSLWEDALADGLVCVVRDGERTVVELSAAGRAALHAA